MVSHTFKIYRYLLLQAFKVCLTILGHYALKGLRGGVVFSGGRKMKIFSTVFRDFGKNMVGKRYFQHYTVPVITGKNNEKSGFGIIKNGILIFEHPLKKSFAFKTWQVFGRLLMSQNVIL